MHIAELVGAGATRALSFDFSGSASDLAPLAALYSLAPSDSCVHDGELWLTEGDVVERSIVVEAPLLVGWRFFEARFGLNIGGGSIGGGEGLSVCVGVLPDAPFGERGVGDDTLCVLLLTRQAAVEVHFGGQLVQRAAVSADLLRGGRSVPVLLRYDAESRLSDASVPLAGESRGLHLSIDGSVLVSDTLLRRGSRRRSGALALVRGLVWTERMHTAWTTL